MTDEQHAILVVLIESKHLSEHDLADLDFLLDQQVVDWDDVIVWLRSLDNI